MSLYLPGNINPTVSFSSFDPWVDLYRSVVEDFSRLSCDPSNSPVVAIQSSISKCAELLLPLTFRNKALDASLFTCSVMYIAKVRGNSALQEVALSSYSNALCRFRSEITKVCETQSQQTQQKQLLLSINMTLVFFEVSRDTESVTYLWQGLFASCYIIYCILTYMLTFTCSILRTAQMVRVLQVTSVARFL